MTATHAYAFLGFGSNLGERRDNISNGLAVLQESGHVKVIKVSSLYETDPVGYLEQGLFLNAVVKVETDLLPQELLYLCKDAEVQVGRKPTVRWGPRVLDIDILMYLVESGDVSAGDECSSIQVEIDSPTLTLPHPRLWERGFVIVPLAELNPKLPPPDTHRLKVLSRDAAMWDGLKLSETGRWWHRDGVNGSSHKGWQVMRFDEVESTNAVAAHLASNGAPEGTCIIAETQSAGKGRRGRLWHSPPGGLWLSILLRPGIQSQDVSKLSLIAGVAVACAIRDTLRLPAVIKWPNDVLVSGKKVCGILPETRFAGDVMDFAIVGIGVNVAIDTNLLPVEVQKTCATLMRSDHPGASAAREGLIVSILKNFIFLYRQFLYEGFLEILLKVREYCDTLGQEVVVSGVGVPVHGIAVDIDSDGRLVVRTRSGRDVCLVSGEVSVRAPGGGYTWE